MGVVPLAALPVREALKREVSDQCVCAESGSSQRSSRGRTDTKGGEYAVVNNTTAEGSGESAYITTGGVKIHHCNTTAQGREDTAR